MKETRDKILNKIAPHGLIDTKPIPQLSIKSTLDFYFITKVLKISNAFCDIMAKKAIDSMYNENAGVFNRVYGYSSVLTNNVHVLYATCLAFLCGHRLRRASYIYGLKHFWVFNNQDGSRLLKGPRMQAWERFVLARCCSKLITFPLCYISFVRKMLRERKYDKTYASIHIDNLIYLEIADIRWLKRLYYRAMTHKYKDMGELLGLEYGEGSVLTTLASNFTWERK